MKLISIVIVTYNSESLIKECLDSIFRYNDIGDALEIIVVDNNSTNSDLLINTIKSYYPTVICIKNEKNGGYGQGNNIGIENAHAPIILIMNPDVRLIMPIFKTAIRHFKENQNLVMLGMKQFKSANIKSNSFIAGGLTMNPFIVIFLTKILNKLDIFLSNCMYIEGACFFIHKSKFINVGCFDENLFMYGEEIDIMTRINRYYNLDKIIVFDKDMSYIHLISDREYLENKEMKINFSNLYLCDKFNIDRKIYIRNRIILYRLLYIYYIFKDTNKLPIFTNLIMNTKNIK